MGQNPEYIAKHNEAGAVGTVYVTKSVNAVKDTTEMNNHLLATFPGHANLTDLHMPYPTC